MKKMLTALGLLFAVALVGLLSLFGINTASAHTPTFSANCEGFHASLNSYPSGSHVTVTIDGATQTDTDFHPAFSKDYPWDDSKSHTWHIVVTSGDQHHQFDRDASGTQEACTQPCPPGSTVTVSVPTTVYETTTLPGETTTVTETLPGETTTVTQPGETETVTATATETDTATVTENSTATATETDTATLIPPTSSTRGSDSQRHFVPGQPVPTNFEAGIGDQTLGNAGGPDLATTFAGIGLITAGIGGAVLLRRKGGQHE